MKISKLGGKVEIKAPVTAGVKIGFGHLGIMDDCREKAIWENSGTVIFDSIANLNVGSRIICGHDATLTFGKDVIFTGKSSIICWNDIRIGRECLISWDCLIIDTDFHKIFKDGIQTNPNQPIEIKDHVWVGCRSTILKGATIPCDSIIAAGSIVSKKLEHEGCTYFGNVIGREGINWSH